MKIEVLILIVSMALAGCATTATYGEKACQEQETNGLNAAFEFAQRAQVDF